MLFFYCFFIRNRWVVWIDWPASIYIITSRKRESELVVVSVIFPKILSDLLRWISSKQDTGSFLLYSFCFIGFLLLRLFLFFYDGHLSIIGIACRKRKKERREGKREKVMLLGVVFLFLYGIWILSDMCVVYMRGMLRAFYYYIYTSTAAFVNVWREHDFGRAAMLIAC